MSHTTPNEAAAAELRAQMARLQVSGLELARRLGKSDMWVHRRTSGATALTPNDAHDIAAALGIDAGVLLAPAPTS